jgi:hypothetical protein
MMHVDTVVRIAHMRLQELKKAGTSKQLARPSYPDAERQPRIPKHPLNR